VESLIVVVLDANVYIDAIATSDAAVLGDPPNLARIPSLPPQTVHPALHVLGDIRDGASRGIGPALEVSDHILAMVENKLCMWGWEDKRIDAYLDAICGLASLSGGGYNENVPRTQHDSRDHEDNLILDLAAEVDADLIVTSDSDLLSLGPAWKGRPVITPVHYVDRADYAARRRVH
jgi:putative PIN family toxin of toxin-antitoxin system